jgi:hypothetical protein
MVLFEEKKFTIEVAGPFPVEMWREMFREMIEVLQSEDENFHKKRFYYLELMLEMMPDINTMNRMLPEETKIEQPAND